MSVWHGAAAVRIFTIKLSKKCTILCGCTNLCKGFPFFCRTEYWKATKKTWCECCRMFYLDNYLNRRHHENSSKHQDNLRKHVDAVRLKGQAKDAKTSQEKPQKETFYRSGEKKGFSENGE